MSHKKINWIGAIAAASALLFAVQNAQALSIRLTDGVNTVTVADGDNDGVVNYIGSLGGATVWTVNVTTGISDPVLAPPYPHTDLNSVNVSGGAGTLSIYLTDTNFDTLAGFLSSIGGTTQGSVTAWLYVDAGNAEFAETTLLLTHGPFGSGGFSQDLAGLFAGTTPYSLTMRVDITHTGAGQVSSFDWNIRTVPEPMSLSIFGLGLLGMGLAARKRKA